MGGKLFPPFYWGEALVDFPCKIGGFVFPSPQNLRGNSNISPKNILGETRFPDPTIIGGNHLEANHSMGGGIILSTCFSPI